MRGFALVAASAGALMLAACSPQQKEADKLGFASVDEMHDIQTQGWHTKSQYLIDQNSAARKLGFTDFDEMQSARKAGYADKASWDKHLKQPNVVESVKAPANEQSLLDRVDGKRWSMYGLSCDLNGGTFEVYSKDNGVTTTLAGKVDNGDAPVHFSFTNLTPNGFVLTVDRTASGAALSVLHDPNIVTLHSVWNVNVVDNTHLSVHKAIKMINVTQMMNGNVQYDNAVEDDNKALCP